MAVAVGVTDETELVGRHVSEGREPGASSSGLRAFAASIGPVVRKYWVYSENDACM